MAVDWAPTADRDMLALRANVLRSIRTFFHRRQVLEVQTPLVSASGNTDPNIESIACEGGFLRTSPEFPMKRLLAAGLGPIYELGPVFRRAERGRRHNSEFTMLEWYRPGFDHFRLMEEVTELVIEVFASQDRRLSAQRYSYRDLLMDHCGFDPIDAPDRRLMDWVRDRHGYAGSLERSECLDLILSLDVSPSLDPGRLTLVHGFPACQAALARLDPENPGTAMRFEVFLGGMELANGYNELCDADELEQRMIAENQLRTKRGQPVMPVDERLLSATRNGIAACAGVALGVDRLLMALAGADRIDAVMPFPQERA